MTLKIAWTHKHDKIKMNSGEFYSFNYSGFENDPHPHIIMINKWSGHNPNTGHEYRFIQAINLNYVQRSKRKQFVNDWLKEWENSKGNIKFTWENVQKKYPYLKFYIRRYFYKPKYYISKLEYLDTEKKIKNKLIRNWYKDFSKSISSKIAKFFKRK